MGDAQRSDAGLIVEVHDRVAYATIDRPERLNTLSVGLTNDLVDAFDAFSTDPDIWAVLLTSTGERAFSAGADLKDMGQADAKTRQASDTPTTSRGRPGTVPMTGSRRNFFEVILECSKPTVAAMFGWAMGGGCELGLACDIRVAADDLRIGMPETKRGLGANFGSVILPRVVPLGLAYQMLYTGEPLDAEDALRWGLVQSVVPARRVDGRSRSAGALDRGQCAADQPALQGHDHQGTRPAGVRRVAPERGAEPVPVRRPQGRRRCVPRTSSAQLAGPMSTGWFMSAGQRCRCFVASRNDSGDSSARCCATNRSTASGSVHAYCRNAQPMALRRKKSRSAARVRQ